MNDGMGRMYIFNSVKQAMGEWNGSMEEEKCMEEQSSSLILREARTHQTTIKQVHVTF